MEQSEQDLRDPRSHFALKRLLDAPDELGLTAAGLHRFQRGLAAILQLSDDRAREQALAALNSGLAGAVGRNRLHKELTIVQSQLAKARPELSELNTLAALLDAQMTYLRATYAKVAESERARGVNLMETGWSYLAHEINATQSTMRVALSRFRKAAASALSADESGEDTNDGQIGD